MDLDRLDTKIELTPDGNNSREEFKKELEVLVIGQDEAKKAVSDALFKNINAIVPKQGPLGVFLFAGPSGVGKTEMAHALAYSLLGNSDRLTTVNCENLAQSHTSSNLFGSPKGYVGYGDVTLIELHGRHYLEAQKDNVVNPLIKRFTGFSIVLFDEIEKAHPVIHQSLLGIFDKGSAKLGDGTGIDFGNSIIIMTTNVGECDIRENESKHTMGFIAPDKTGDRAKIFKDGLKKFSPEFLGRIDNIVHFKNLTEKDCEAILKGRVDRLNKVLSATAKTSKTTNLELHLTPLVYKHLVKLGYHPNVGARDLVRVFDREINSNLGEILQNPKLSTLFDFPYKRATIIGEMKKDKIVFSLSKKNVIDIQDDVQDNVYGIIYH